VLSPPSPAAIRASQTQRGEKGKKGKKVVRWNSSTFRAEELENTEKRRKKGSYFCGFMGLRARGGGEEEKKKDERGCRTGTTRGGGGATSSTLALKRKVADILFVLR